MRLKKPHRLRVILLGGVFIALTGVVTARLIHLQHLESDRFARQATVRHYRNAVIQPERGDIFDRNGRALAQSTGRVSIWISPPNFRIERIDRENQATYTEVDKADFAYRIAAETGEDVADLLRRLEGRSATVLVRRAHPDTANRVRQILREARIDGRGYWFERESQRIYPTSIAAELIGFCGRNEDGDNRGLGGVELSYNDLLSGQRVESRSSFSGFQQQLNAWSEEDIAAARGKSLVLTIDATLQETVEKVLAETVEKFSAASANAIVMDVHSGAILAMGGYPTFDNNQFQSTSPSLLRNRALTDPLETGSVIKLMTAAMVIDRGYMTPETLIDCEGGFAVVDGRRLRDSPGHVLRVATFREVLRWSSNVGIAKAAQPLENREWYNYLRGFGFGGPTGIDLPGEGSGILYPVERWTRLSRTSLPMGYEIAVTPIQTAAAISSLVNGGYYYEPYVVAETRQPDGTLIERREPKVLRQVIRPTTSAVMRDLMEDIVESGTGKRAIVQGVRIGGKTGTTRKSDIFDRREYISSFAGVLPINDPQICIYLYVDAPKGDYYASIVAAPAFQQIARAAVLHLGITPSETLPVARVDMPIVRPQAIQAASEEPAPLAGTAAGIMPKLDGMSIAQVRRRLPEEVASATLLGSGFATDQFPLPGEPITNLTEIVVHFSPVPPAPPEPAPQQKGVMR